jgi:2'-hydroxyisoflavone reductase
MLNGIRATTSSAVDFCWIDSKFLTENNVDGRELPMWNDSIFPGNKKVIENQTSMDAGLTFRPVAETAVDTLAWYRQLPKDKQVFTRAGIDPEKEARVLAAWHQQSGDQT